MEYSTIDFEQYYANKMAPDECREFKRFLAASKFNAAAYEGFCISREEEDKILPGKVINICPSNYSWVKRFVIAVAVLILVWMPVKEYFSDSHGRDLHSSVQPNIGPAFVENELKVTSDVNMNVSKNDSFLGAKIKKRNIEFQQIAKASTPITSFENVKDKKDSLMNLEYYSKSNVELICRSNIIDQKNVGNAISSFSSSASTINEFKSKLTSANGYYVGSFFNGKMFIDYPYRFSNDFKPFIPWAATSKIQIAGYPVFSSHLSFRSSLYWGSIKGFSMDFSAEEMIGAGFNESNPLKGSIKNINRVGCYPTIVNVALSSSCCAEKLNFE
jgi:hypothetical protein